MICYKDRTFCPFYHDCVLAKTCPRPLTPDVEHEAVKVGLPISQYVEPPNCHTTEADVRKAFIDGLVELSGNPESRAKYEALATDVLRGMCDRIGGSND